VVAREFESIAFLADDEFASGEAFRHVLDLAFPEIKYPGTGEVCYLLGLRSGGEKENGNGKWQNILHAEVLMATRYISLS
jgi:hypothetical protein